MRHKTKRQAIDAAKADHLAGRYNITHRCGYDRVCYVAEVDGVWRCERDGCGGTQGIRVPNRRIYRAKLPCSV